MRYLFLAATGVVVAMAANTAPAKAYDYPFCLYDRNTTDRGDCSYSTYNQCRASASGRQAYCEPNYFLGYFDEPAPGTRPARRVRRAY